MLTGNCSFVIRIILENKPEPTISREWLNLTVKETKSWSIIAAFITRVYSRKKTWVKYFLKMTTINC